VPVRSAEDGDVLERLEKCLRQGDWNAVARLTALVRSTPPPATAEALGDHLRRLKRALVSARVARANLSLSSARLRAAAGFAHAGALPARQEFADPAES